jgi:hypothetical protein
LSFFSGLQTLKSELGLQKELDFELKRKRKQTVQLQDKVTKRDLVKTGGAFRLIKTEAHESKYKKIPPKLKVKLKTHSINVKSVKPIGNATGFEIDKLGVSVRVNIS